MPITYWGGSAKLECEIVNNREDQNAQLDDGNTQRISVHCPGPASAMGRGGRRGEITDPTRPWSHR